MQGKSRKLWLGAVIAAATAVVLLSQNCTKPESTRQNQSSGSTTTAAHGGDGYDGKLFINRLIGSVCPDGSDVKNSVEVVSYTSAFVTRENCQPVNRRPLNSSQFSYMPHNLQNLIYSDRTFDRDPSVSQDPRATTYLCRGDETAEYYRVFHNVNLPPSFKDRYGDLIFRPNSSATGQTAKLALGFYEQGSRTQMVGNAYQSGEFPATLDTSGTPWILSGTDSQGVTISWALARRTDGTLVGKGIYLRDPNGPPAGPTDIPNFNLNLICYPQ